MRPSSTCFIRRMRRLDGRGSDSTGVNGNVLPVTSTDVDTPAAVRSRSRSFRLRGKCGVATLALASDSHSSCRPPPVWICFFCLIDFSLGFRGDVGFLAGGVLALPLPEFLPGRLGVSFPPCALLAFLGLRGGTGLIAPVFSRVSGASSRVETAPWCLTTDS